MDFFRFVWARISFLLSSLRAKIAFAFVLLVVIMAVVSYLYSYREIRRERLEMRARMERIAKQIASIRLAETEGWYVYQDYIDDLIRTDFNKDIVYIAIFNEDDSLAAFTLNTDWIEADESRLLSRRGQREIVQQLAQGMVAQESRDDLDSVPVQIQEENYALGTIATLGTVDVGFSLIDINIAINRKRWDNFFMLAIFTIIGVTTSALISYRIIRPLGRLSSAMQKVSEGELSADVEVRSRDEIGELASTFNRMLRGLRDKAHIEDFSRELGFDVKMTSVEKLVVERIVSSISARRGVLFLGTDAEKEFYFVPVWDSLEGEIIEERSGIALTDYEPALVKRTPLALQYLEGKSKQLSVRFSESGIADAQLLLPLVAKDEVVGVVVLSGKKSGEGYSSDDVHFLETLAGQAALALENARLQEELTEQERLKRELEIARNVQKKLLPQENPRIEGWDIDGICIPAAEVGGDYYDFFELGEFKIGAVIADVTGKGTSAAFYMAEIKGMMISLCPVCASPEELLCQLNRRMYTSYDPKVFATMLYVELDLRSGVVRFARAGHESLLMKRAEKSTVSQLLPEGIGLGLAGAEKFNGHIAQQEVRLREGDILVMYTDGIVEARNTQREEYGEKALMGAIAKCHGSSAGECREYILRELRDFVGNATQHDDITMLIIGKK